MEKNLYIDASHPNEIRVVLKSGDNIEDYEYEGLKNNLIKNNIYLGKVSRIEPSLQAAFIDFGRDKHGFLSFNDIQSDYYQIPQSDLAKIKDEEEKAREALSKETPEEEAIVSARSFSLFYFRRRHFCHHAQLPRLYKHSWVLEAANFLHACSLL